MIDPNKGARVLRPIDRIREGAGRAQIPPGHGKIISMRGVGQRMYFIAERGLTSGVLADAIDPERINPKLPFMVQRVELAYGAEHPIVQKTVCVAFQLFDQTYLPDHVNNDAGVVLAVEIATSLASVVDEIAELRVQEAETRSKGNAGELSIAHLPRTANLKGRVHQCLAALRDVEISIKKTAAQFYPKDAPNDPWDAKFRPALLEKHGAADGFGEHVTALWKVMENAGDYRHAMIHPDDTKSLTVYDYELEANGVIVAPTLEIKHPRSSVSRRDIVQFLDSQVAHIADTYELLLSYMCDLNVRTLNEVFESYIMNLPGEERRQGSKLAWQTTIREGVPNPFASAGQ